MKLQFLSFAVPLVSAVCPYMTGDLPGSDLKARDEPDGESHFLDQFVVDDNGKFTTTDFGTPVDDTNSIKVGPRGSTLLEDFVLRTKITRFDHERIPERAVHARGAAAHGFFESYENWSNITAADFLSEKGKKTPVFIRFSTVAGSAGSPDTARDVHGFAVRFYTDQGNYDVVGNNIPTFFIQDAIQFPDLIHSVKPRADTGIPQAGTAHDSAYDFFSQNPSTMHTLLWALAGNGIVRSYRTMNGFGVHTFRFVNAEGKSKLIKIHFTSLQGRASLVWQEAQQISGHNIDFHRQDITDAINDGNFPQWEMGVQIMEEDDVLRFGFDLLDPTKLVPVELAPITPIGKITLNRNVLNFFAETEQSMFNPGHVVRGIDFTEDPLLQGRLFSYVDTQLNRNMGSPNFEQIPINRPISGVHNNNRDGSGQQFIHSNVNPYTFNSLNGGFPAPANQTVGNGFFTAPVRKVVDAHYVREKSPTFLDFWSQPRLFWNSIGDAEKQMVVNAARFELANVASEQVKKNVLIQFNRIAHELASRVAKALGMEAPAPDSKYYHNNKTAGIALFEEKLPTIAGLRIAVLASAAEPSSIKQAGDIANAFKGKGVKVIVIAERLTGGVQATYEGSVPALFDAAIVVGGTEKLFDPMTVSTLYPPGRPLQFVREAFWFGKPVGSLGNGKVAFDRAGVPTKRDGVYLAKSTSELVSGIEAGLKTFKFVDRFPLDK